jgi:tRNA U34 5-carboxymethylaminomethyl modifying GTPase MnmE/TrmE
MQPMKSVIAIVLVFLFWSCNNQQVVENKAKVEKLCAAKDVNSNQVLVTEVEGMVCKMGCGGALRKELLATCSVSKVEVEYEEDRKKQVVRVHFDNSKISETILLNTMENVNDGQFSVQAIGSVNEGGSALNNKSGNDGAIQMKNQNFELPSIFDALIGIFVTK